MEREVAADGAPSNEGQSDLRDSKHSLILDPDQAPAAADAGKMRMQQRICRRLQLVTGLVPRVVC